MSSHIHGVLFDKIKWTPTTSLNWLKEHKLKPIRPRNISERYFRYRITIPNYNLYDYYTKDIGHGIKFILGFDKI